MKIANAIHRFLKGFSSGYEPKTFHFRIAQYHQKKRIKFSAIPT